ncbi:MAG: C4-type zinc ribbon domain-containing protein [Clostridia bacterium]|nr:C4-type zinc ribbon domain-containing protein [Clostridia bacterium]
MEQVKKLLALQSLEKRQRELKTALRQMPMVRELRRLKEAIEGGQDEMRTGKERYNNLGQAIIKGENICYQLRQKIEELQEQLYSGMINNPKELENLEGQLVLHKEQLEAKEERVFQLMEEKENLYRALLNSRAEVERLKEEFRSLRIQYQVRQEEMNHELEDIPGALTRITSEIDPDSLGHYNKLKSRHRNSMVAMAVNNICAGCHFTLAFDTIKKLKEINELVFCDNCGRILYPSGS